jgi:tRNA-specific 2-thiouridylase
MTDSGGIDTVLVAMSGGVDSSVAAFLTSRGGRRCIGVTMKLFDIPEENKLEKSCCSLSDVNDARDVAYRLDFPHYVLNLKAAFAQEVIEKFIRVYKEGGTPNPCIECNRSIKFNTLLVRAAELQAAYMATGHYARVEKSGGRFLLKKGHDARKDQSYVLYTMTQEQLSRALFPLGDLTKEEVRAIARENNFINAHKRESQDICFVPDGDYGRFIEEWTGEKTRAGAILDLAGNKIGEHRGFIRYTIGQRRGLGVSAREPYYVCAKSPEHNTISAGPERALYASALSAGDLNLIACDAINAPLRVMAKTRYRQEAVRATVEQTGPDTLRVEFDEPQRAITRGQALVLYVDDLVLGGGTIYSTA